MRPSAVIAAFAVCALAAAAADEPQNPITKGMSNPNAPITYSADHFQADANAKTGIFYGNVIIHQGEVSMHADAVRFHVVDNKPDKIFANGSVVVDAPSGVATGDSGVYDVNPRLITLNGNVVLTKGKDVMRGQTLTVNLVTGVARLNGGQGRTGRIQGLFTPSDKSTQNP
jgi:lipopolysaccharide export system protein LptA